MRILTSLVIATVMLATSSANAALVSRLGGAAYYDDVANLTWLADANAAGKTINWASANYTTEDGIGGWRLANTVQADASCDSSANN